MSGANLADHDVQNTVQLSSCLLENGLMASEAAKDLRHMTSVLDPAALPDSEARKAALGHNAGLTDEKSYAGLLKGILSNRHLTIALARKGED